MAWHHVRLPSGRRRRGPRSAPAATSRRSVTVGLIVKRNTNPFWVTMKDTAEATADDDNVKLLTAAGKSDIDNASQVAALAKMTAEGAKGIMITPADSTAIVPAIEKARQRGRDRDRAGHAHGAADRPSTRSMPPTTSRPASSSAATRRPRPRSEAIKPRIAMLDLSPGITSGELRHQGFLKGFGIRTAPEIVGSVDTLWRDGARRGRPARAAGEGRRHQRRLHRQRARGLRRRAGPQGGRHRDNGSVILVSVDGGCDAVKDGVRPGVIDATAQQYPENMARLGVDALADAARGGRKPPGTRTPASSSSPATRRRRALQGRGLRRAQLLGLRSRAATVAAGHLPPRSGGAYPKRVTFPPSAVSVKSKDTPPHRTTPPSAKDSS